MAGHKRNIKSYNKFCLNTGKKKGHCEGLYHMANTALC